MDWQHKMPTQPLQWSGRVILLEAQRGQSRRDCLQQWLNEVQYSKATTWLLSCAHDEGGPWAGVKDLLQDIVAEVQIHAADLIIKHDYELVSVLPALLRSISVRRPTLTDKAELLERVRLYPSDRAFRIVHGLIDFLSTWHHLCNGSPLVIACDDYDYTGVLVQHFFVELMRRRAQYLNLTLLIATDLGSGEIVAEKFDTKFLGACVRLNLSSASITPVSEQEMTHLAQELEHQVGEDEIQIELNLPQLIRYWLLSNQPEKALKYQLEACFICTRRGFYEDGLVYGEAALAQLERYCPEDIQKRFILYSKLYGCYATLKRPLQALQVIETAITKLDVPEYLFQSYYMIAMLYARHLPNRDLAKAEEYLQRGLEELARANLPKHTKLFYTAFNQNGLALIRHRQGRFQEAVELCRSYYEQLNTQLKPDEHLLHRSVLLYNIAQIYASIEPYEEAITYFTNAIAIDPNYSEYYNERGNVYVKMGYLEKALNDYLKAIELSPPYSEVWSNLGRCYRMIGQTLKAIDAYSTSLDLDPKQFSVWVARAEAFEILEQPDAALINYNAALALDGNQPLVLGNRAILHYEAARYQESLADLEQAIALSPETPDLYQNRAVALTALGRLEEAARDLKTYLNFNPTAVDYSEVESTL